MERAAERNIQSVLRAGVQHKFGRILIPTEEVVEVNGQKDDRTQVFPGYVLVEMIMDDDTRHLVKQTSKVTGFVGGAQTSGAHLEGRGRENRQPDAGRQREAAPQGGI